MSIHTQITHAVPLWTYDENKKWIQRDFKFKDFHHTMAFVNAIAWLAHQSNHHPDMEVGYNYCRVKYTTHDAGDVTEKDMECALAVDALM